MKDNKEELWRLPMSRGIRMAQKVDQFSVICTRWLVGRARRSDLVKKGPPADPVDSLLFCQTSDASVS
ncbi:hypothetical protein X777_05019 [Ooceraea biroi]|uniref:Uncharacterized protein n=1 Tax=Ooceraea biroi TaxID=2015173 RepID=A0A026WI05_OOCBI|nr:hypothetical protein X777_05019 [Ooceraea biroi]